MHKLEIEVLPPKDETAFNAQEEQVELNQEQPALLGEVMIEDTAWSPEKLDRMQDDLKLFTDSMKQYPSFFDKATAVWAKMPWWLLVMIIIPLVALPLSLGIVFSIWSLVVIGVAIFISCLAFNLFFYNHNVHQAKNSDFIHQELNKLAINLDNQITKLDLQHQEIVRETEQLQTENRKLALELDKLEDQNSLFTNQLNQMQENTEELIDNNKVLEVLVNKLERCNEEKLAQGQIYQGMIEQLKTDREENLIALTQQMYLLNEDKNNFDKALEMENNLLQTLRNSAERFKTAVIPSEKDRVLFQEKINSFFIHKDSAVVLITQRMADSKKELLVLKEQLHLIKQRRLALLDRHKSVVDRIETTVAPSSHGFFTADKSLVDSEIGEFSEDTLFKNSQALQ